MENRERIWVASYAKSGTTWLRFLLTGLLEGPPQTSAAVDACVPSVHAAGQPSRSPHTDAGLFHTHQSYDHSLAQFGPSGGFLYIARHPLDVLLSNMNFFILTQLQNLQRRRGTEGEAPTEDEVNLLATHYVVEFLSQGGDAHGIQIGYGTWEQNVTSWLEAAESQPALILRYEDLKRDIRLQVTRICAFLQLERSDAQLDDAIEAASFERMRAIENREIADKVEGRFYRPGYRAGHEAGIRFVHRGEVGAGERLPAQVIDQMATRLEATMAKLGYGIDQRRAITRPFVHEVGASSPARMTYSMWST